MTIPKEFVERIISQVQEQRHASRPSERFLENAASALLQQGYNPSDTLKVLVVGIEQLDAFQVREFDQSLLAVSLGSYKEGAEPAIKGVLAGDTGFNAGALLIGLATSNIPKSERHLPLTKENITMGASELIKARNARMPQI